MMSKTRCHSERVVRAWEGSKYRVDGSDWCKVNANAPRFEDQEKEDES